MVLIFATTASIEDGDAEEGVEGVSDVGVEGADDLSKRSNTDARRDVTALSCSPV